MRESQFNLALADSHGTVYLYNTRTSRSAIFPASLRREQGRSTLYHSRLAELVADEFVVDEDPAAELAELERRHVKVRRSADSVSLVLAPTMWCNLDCDYCFEGDKYKGVMPQEVQDGIVSLVRRHFLEGTQTLSVTWYGGEPLVALHVIRALASRLKQLAQDFGRTFNQTIVTNGTLMTDKVAADLTSLGVQSAQITLDGDREAHDLSRVSRTGKPTFDRVVAGIRAATAHMPVSVRVNVDANSATQLSRMLDSLESHGLRDKVSLYLAPIRNANVADRPSIDAVAKQRVIPIQAASDAMSCRVTLSGQEGANAECEFDNLLLARGFRASPRLPRAIFSTCIADRSHSWLIEPSGAVQKCFETAGTQHEAVGWLRADGSIELTDTAKRWDQWTPFRVEACQKCPMLPVCMGHCPIQHLSNDPEHCPRFKYNWTRVLGQHFGVHDDGVHPIGALELVPEDERRTSTSEYMRRVAVRASAAVADVNFRLVPSDPQEEVASERLAGGTPNSTARTLLTLLSRPQSVRSLVEALNEVHPEVPEEQLRIDVVAFLSDLVSSGRAEASTVASTEAASA